jgi:methylmalonyl-CoA mutase N-terminal domain/subunit
VVGLNRFVDSDDAGVHPPLQRIDDDAEARQAAGVRRVRAERDPERWRRAIAALDERARGEGNLLPLLIDAVGARATLGEISDVLRRAWGEHRELLTL